MTVRHRQRKGAQGSSFLYARGKGFSKPPTFPPNRPKIPCTWPDNPTHAASFSRQFSARTAHRPPRLGQKKGLLRPSARQPRLLPARTPRFAPAPPVFCPARARMEPRLAPVLPGTPAPAHTPGTPEAPACAAFLPARARFRPPCAARTPEGCPARRRNHPAVRRQPARCRRPPPEGQPPPRRGTALGLATPTAVVCFPASPWRSVRP